MKRSIVAETWTSTEELPEADQQKSEAREASQTRVPLIYSNLFITAVQLVTRWLL